MCRRIGGVSSAPDNPSENSTYGSGNALGKIPGICWWFHHRTFIEIEAETGRDAESLNNRKSQYSSHLTDNS